MRSIDSDYLKDLYTISERDCLGARTWMWSRSARWYRYLSDQVDGRIPESYLKIFDALVCL